jgi:3-oxoacyl-[acyl-carrier protein] reductase
MDLGLSGKPAFVTGGSRGLGRAVCLALAAEGARVAVGYRNDAAAAGETLSAIRGPGEKAPPGGGGAFAVRINVADEADAKRAFDEAEAAFGSPVEVLVNNAAVCPHGRVDGTSLDSWNEAISTNLTGTFLACREMVGRLSPTGRPGRIVNVSSAAAFHGSTSGQAAYDASKGGVVSLTVSLSREIAGLGITANALVPGLMMTDMTREKFSAGSDKYLSRIPLGRFAELDEVAAAVAFLCSRQAAYITGTALNVSGGLLMR